MDRDDGGLAPVGDIAGLLDIFGYTVEARWFMGNIRSASIELGDHHCDDYIGPGGRLRIARGRQ